MKTAALLLAAAVTASAQLSAPNEAGVSMGHLHLNVRDVEAHTKFWTEHLGAAAVKFGRTDVMKYPGVLIFLTRRDPTGGTEGSVVHHVGFLVPDLDANLRKWKESGVRIVQENLAARQVFLLAPDDIRVEITEDKSISAPIVNHHIHFFNVAVDDTKAWYIKTFGAKGGKRGRFEAADLPGVNLTFSPSETPTAPTRGRALDHIGFEVKDLEAFCKKLEAAGVKFNIPYRKTPAIAIAFFTDPWGTYIELTEGLNRL
ncbi:MAG: VOC family protein [Bryobacteraceae bacterium]